MPKIAAPTVKEHRENVRAALVDAAEQLLRASGGRTVTAAAVTAQAGIARNSIYRYVESVDDLRGLVLARYLPQWREEVDRAVAGTTDARERIRTWARANLEQAATYGHGWLIEVARGAQLTEGTQEGLAEVHGRMGDSLLTAWTELAGERAGIGADLTRALVDAGFTRLDRGDALDAIAPFVLASVDAVVDAVVGVP